MRNPPKKKPNEWKPQIEPFLIVYVGKINWKWEMLLRGEWQLSNEWISRSSSKSQSELDAAYYMQSLLQVKKKSNFRELSYLAKLWEKLLRERFERDATYFTESNVKFCSLERTFSAFENTRRSTQEIREMQYKMMLRKDLKTLVEVVLMQLP